MKNENLKTDRFQKISSDNELGIMVLYTIEASVYNFLCKI